MRLGENITTTAGETFTHEESCQLAALVLKRFGWETELAASAWRRLLGNDCSDDEFYALACLATAQVRRGLR